MGYGAKGGVGEAAAARPHLGLKRKRGGMGWDGVAWNGMGWDGLPPSLLPAALIHFPGPALRCAVPRRPRA